MTEELKILEHEHSYVLRAIQDQAIELKVFLMASTFDKPAEALVQNTAEPIAKFGCSQCELAGRYRFLYDMIALQQKKAHLTNELFCFD